MLQSTRNAGMAPFHMERNLRAPCCVRRMHIVLMGITGLSALGSGVVVAFSWLSSSVISSEGTLGAGSVFIVNVIAFGYIADIVVSRGFCLKEKNKR